MKLLDNILAQSLAAPAPLPAAPGPVGPDGQPLQPAEQAPPEQFFSDLPIDDIWSLIAGITWLHAVLLLATGVIYLMYGWRLFRILVLINFAVGGMFAGITLGRLLGSPLWGGILGATMLGTVSWPLMKYAVAILGAFSGAVIGGALWRIIGLPDQIIWSGALAGLVGGGFLAFSSYRTSIILFSSLQGALFLAVGILALLNDYPNLGAHVAEVVYSNSFFLPLLVIVPTLTGIFCQQKLLRREADWDMPE